MDAIQRKHFGFLLLTAIAIFLFFTLPNAAASKNPAMVQVFSADESSPLPTVFRMVAPAGSFEQTVKNFIFYGYYPYGLVHFAFSALVIVPLQWLGWLGNTTLVMLVLRQMVSVLPMLAALLILVYMQDGFRTYRSFVLFIFLASIPAVIDNNLWWHPDGLVTFFAALTLFFLVRDRLRFGIDFYLAALACGLATAVKLVGVFFFLAIGLVLVLGLFQKRITWYKALKVAAIFIAIMAGAYLITNPFLFFSSTRAQFFKTMQNQSAAISAGYGIVYPKGLLASWPIVHQFYGEFIFLLVSLACAIWGIFRGSKRLLYALILAWFIPLSVMVFHFSHFKFQYWLPAILPVLSCVVVLLPEKLNLQLKRRPLRWLGLAGLLVVSVQFGLFLRIDRSAYVSALHREQGNLAIQFYAKAVDVLAPIGDAPVYIYYDPNMYMPPTRQWSFNTTFDLLSYAMIHENNYGVVLLEQSRIRDYLNPNAVGIDPVKFTENQVFYRQADVDELTGYHLIFSNDYGKVFVREDIYRIYFESTANIGFK